MIRQPNFPTFNQPKRKQMNPKLKNILSVIAGAFIGSIVNMALIMSSGKIIPLPEGVDTTTEEGLKAAMPLLEPKHFIIPFLAHALGTLAGAIIAAKLAATNKARCAYVVGVLFLIGGIANVFMLGAPMWFNILDLVAAYLPMAFIAKKIAVKNS